MPSYLEATVILPLDAARNEQDKEARYDSMRDGLGRWTIKDMWWGEKGINGPAALLEIESSSDMLAQLFAITDMGYVITHVHFKYREGDVAGRSTPPPDDVRGHRGRRRR